MEVIKALFSSKKFVAFLITSIVAIGGRVGLSFPPDLVAELVAIGVAFILGQGISDAGKDAARITAVAASAKKPTAQATAAVSEMAADVKKKN